mmetsp:Transcript_41590/g.134170  ORF Transcript_41590/g.134170 Transcript_41590/m.134170 type:complete len:281 (+) Transcript_41590:113-955(+)
MRGGSPQEGVERRRSPVRLLRASLHGCAKLATCASPSCSAGNQSRRRRWLMTVRLRPRRHHHPSHRRRRSRELERDLERERERSFPRSRRRESLRSAKSPSKPEGWTVKEPRGGGARGGWKGAPPQPRLPPGPPFCGGPADVHATRHVFWLSCTSTPSSRLITSRSSSARAKSRANLDAIRSESSASSRLMSTHAVSPGSREYPCRTGGRAGAPPNGPATGGATASTRGGPRGTYTPSPPPPPDGASGAARCHSLAPAAPPPAEGGTTRHNLSRSNTSTA